MWSASWRIEMCQEDSRGITYTLDVCVFGNAFVLNERGKRQMRENCQ